MIKSPLPSPLRGEAQTSQTNQLGVTSRSSAWKEFVYGPARPLSQTASSAWDTNSVWAPAADFLTRERRLLVSEQA